MLDVAAWSLSAGPLSEVDELVGAADIIVDGLRRPAEPGYPFKLGALPARPAVPHATADQFKFSTIGCWVSHRDRRENPNLLERAACEDVPRFGTNPWAPR